MLKFDVILMPTDLSSHSLRALPYAIGLARQFDAMLEVVSVVEPTLQVADVAWGSVDAAVASERAKTVAQHVKEKIIDQLPSDIRAKSSIVHGNPAANIVRHANEVGADLIVMATHGRGGLGHMLMGSTAEAVVRKSSCPVMTLKLPAVVTVGDEDLQLAEQPAPDSK